MTRKGDFTVIGPAVNEVSRIETLCEPLGRNVLVSAELAAAVGQDCRLVPLGRYSLRGVREARAIYGLECFGSLIRDGDSRPPASGPRQTPKEVQDKAGGRRRADSKGGHSLSADQTWRRE